MATRSRILLLVATLLAAPRPAAAGVYPEGERVPFAVKEDGTAGELSFNFDPPGRLNLLLDKLADLGDVNPARKTPNPARVELLAKVRTPLTETRDPGKLAGRAADLIRLRQADAALNLLSPHGRSGDLRVQATWAHAHAVRGEWAEAARRHEVARLDAEFPRELPGATPAQKAWLEKVERTHYARWIAVHKEEAERRLSPAVEDVFPLFPGVKFVNEKGEYEPGHLAAAEKAKLPPDAVAVVQQLLLWDRDDTRVFWLLGELYAAAGKLREAEIVFDQCASEARLYSNRTILMAHRAAVKRAVAALPKPATPVEEPPPPPKEETVEDLGVSRQKLYAVGGAFAAATVLLLLFQARALRRWLTRKR